MSTVEEHEEEQEEISRLDHYDELVDTLRQVAKELAAYNKISAKTRKRVMDALEYA